MMHRTRRGSHHSCPAPRLEAVSESMEVTREDHLLVQTMESVGDGNFSIGGRSVDASSSPSRKGVKNRLANMLRGRPMNGSSSNSSSQPSHAKPRRNESNAGSPPRTPASSQPQQRRANDLTNSGSLQLRRTRSSTPSSDSDNVSIWSDNVTVEGLRSVGTSVTIGSVETVKHSNKKKPLPAMAKMTAIPVVETSKPPADKPLSKGAESYVPSSKKTTWSKFKRALKPFKTSSSPQISKKTSATSVSNAPAKQAGNRPRVQSYDKVKMTTTTKSDRTQQPHRVSAPPLFQRSKSGGDPMRARSDPLAVERDLATLDNMVRGRLDGLDVMTLGCALWENAPTAHLATLGGTTNYRNTRTSTAQNPWEETRYSVTGRSTFYAPADMVKDMLWTSGGRATPEIILDGCAPGPEDRWSVQIEGTQKPKFEFTYDNNSSVGPPPPGLQEASTDEHTESTATDEYDSPVLSAHKLWTSLWGPDPIPSAKPNRDLINNIAVEGDFVHSGKSDEVDMEADDPLLSLAANSNVPIDIDEDTFIVTTREHLDAIQEIAAVPLSEGRFETALRVLDKLLLGLTSNSRHDQRFLLGATHHNIGLINMWQGNFERANAAFEQALEERKKIMEEDHADLVVTKVRRAQCLFAMERFDEASGLLEECLRLAPQEDAMVRTKVLNNLSMVCYHKHEVSKALRFLAQALELQREFLDGPVKRESIIYDAAVSLSNMGKLYLERSDYALCNSVYEEALLLQTSIFQRDNPIVIQAYINLAWSKGLSGQSTTALKLLESCVRVQSVSYGEDSSSTVETSGWMAHLYSRVERYNEALALYRKIRQWQKQHLKANTPLFHITGPQTSTHPSVKMVKDCIKSIEERNASNASLSPWV
mmetsp:Transcript_27335/g.75360  ORF Transcript_27335/g.75360 Transcript_27335/m.75360 type:complete len:875 (-) Transcript_27335:115-2739(-)